MPETTQFGPPADNGHVDGSLQPNTILLARYRITATIGGGGFGTVYQARDLNFPEAKRLVAVKEMLVTAADPNLRASTMKTFQREANLLATLSHPAIPKIYDFFDQNERAYLVMEHINGNNLEEILVKTKKIPMNKIIEWAIDLCDVLAYLHSHQPEPIIFRDMKPANIMIDNLGKVHLVDFGIAKIFVSGVKQTMIGTEGYSAPEQYRGNANPLSDVYALGATLHQVITRRDPRLEPPFSFAERQLEKFNEEASAELQHILDRALAFEPEKRFQNCVEMKAAFEQLRYRPAGNTFQAVTSAGGGESSTKPAGSASGTDFFSEETLSGEIQARWKFKTEDEIRSSPVSYRGVAYVGSYDTNLWAIKVEDGSFVWKRPTEGGIASAPIIDQQQNQILFGSEDSTYVAVDWRDGRLNWTYHTSDKIRSTGTLAHGHVFFGSDDGKLYAVLAANGRHMWDFDAGSPVRTKPCVTNERIIIGTETGEAIGLELNGTRKWAFRARKAISSSPFVDIEGVCYVGSFDNNLYAIDADSGYSHWRFRTGGPVISSPVVDGNTVFVGSADGNIYAVNTQTGKDRWIFEGIKPFVASPVIHNDVLYIGGTDGYLYAIDSRRGKELWRFKTEGAITSAPHIADNLILVGSMDKTLYALPLVNN